MYLSYFFWSGDGLIEVVVKIILNRLQSQAEEIIAEEQTGFRARRSTTGQLFNLRILCEKYHQHPYQFFIDFRMAFDILFA